MSPTRRVVGSLFLVLLAPLAAHADARCVLTQVENAETLKRVEGLIVAEHLDLSYGAKERTFVSNDGTIQLKISRTVSRESNSDILASVYLRGVKSLLLIGQSSGSTQAVQTVGMLPDGRVLGLMCYATPDAPRAPAPAN